VDDRKGGFDAREETAPEFPVGAVFFATHPASRGFTKAGRGSLRDEPKAADRLENNINSLATVYYGFSIFHCMTQSLAEGGPGLGTCMGPSKTKHLLTSAGFNRVEQLDIKSQTHLFYAARL
jgi:hypothetical protein